MTPAERLESMLNEVGVPDVHLTEYKGGLMQVRIDCYNGDQIAFNFIEDGETFSLAFCATEDFDDE